MELDNILSLICATIFADKRVLAREIEAFIVLIKDIEYIKSLDPKVSDKKILRWYEDHKSDLRGIVTGPYFKTWFYDCVDKLEHLSVKTKTDILNVMKKISIADQEVHISERALIVLTARRWDMDLGDLFVH